MMLFQKAFPMPKKHRVQYINHRRLRAGERKIVAMSIERQFIYNMSLHTEKPQRPSKYTHTFARAFPIAIRTVYIPKIHFNLPYRSPLSSSPPDPTNLPSSPNFQDRTSLSNSQDNYSAPTRASPSYPQARPPTTRHPVASVQPARLPLQTTAPRVWRLGTCTVRELEHT